MLVEPPVDELTLIVGKGQLLGGRLQRLPAVLHEAHALGEVRERCFAAGMNDCLTKPIRASTLRAAVRRWLAGDGAPAEPGSPDGGD